MRSKNRKKENKNYLINLAKKRRNIISFFFLRIIDFYQIKWADELFYYRFSIRGYFCNTKKKLKAFLSTEFIFRKGLFSKNTLSSIQDFK